MTAVVGQHIQIMATCRGADHEVEIANAPCQATQAGPLAREHSARLVVNAQDGDTRREGAYPYFTLGRITGAENTLVELGERNDGQRQTFRPQLGEPMADRVMPSQPMDCPVGIDEVTELQNFGSPRVFTSGRHRCHG